VSEFFSIRRDCTSKGCGGFACTPTGKCKMREKKTVIEKYFRNRAIITS
jgi:hypothetical protein